MVGAGMCRRQHRKRKRIQFGWFMSRWIRAMPKQFSPDQSAYGEQRMVAKSGRRCRPFSTTARFLRLKSRPVIRTAFTLEQKTEVFFAVAMEGRRGVQTWRVRHCPVMRLRESTQRQ